MLKTILLYVTPVLNVILNIIVVAILGYLGKQAVRLVPKLIAFVVAKIGLTNYQKMKAAAQDIFNKIEEDGRLGELVDTKLNTFTKLLKAKFPAITDEEINLFNKAIAGEFNKDKPAIVAAIEDVAAPVINVVPVTPTRKYIAPDGTELKPVEATDAGDIVSTSVNATATV